jgi:2-dehydro-3-deoxy-D-arabinonate dehydratase
MHITRYADAGGAPFIAVTGDDGTVRPIGVPSLADLLARPLAEIRELVTEAATKDPLDGPLRTLPPVDGATEVWASGVTYKRSREARIEESSDGDVYTRVYDARRPELFFKSVAWRVVGDGDPIAVRADSESNTPEPELALVLNADAELVGLTVCDDVSSRSIEGENPLYLPQAKVYDGCCALGPVITLAERMPPPAEITLRLSIDRAGARVFEGSTSIGKMARSFADLIQWLGKEATFPNGVILLTGTGIVPPDDFTLHVGDVVHIDVSGIGRLSNVVE